MKFKNLLKLLCSLLLTISMGALQAQSCGSPLGITPGVAIVGANTAGAGSNWNVTPCTASSANFYISDDAAEENHVYSYTPAANEDFTVTLANGSTDWAGVHITDGCNDGSANCIGFATLRNGDPAVATGSFCGGVTYYIAVSTWPTPNTVTYDLLLETTPGMPSCDCPADVMIVACDDGDPCTENDMESSIGGVSCGPCVGTPVSVDLTPSCGDIVDYPCGPGGTYPASDNTTWTYCPDPGTYASITFTYVDIEANTSDCPWDALNISSPTGMSGPVCGEPDGDGGIGTGLAAGSCFYSPVVNDCITITFTSDGSVNETGFVFSCDCDVAAPTGTCAEALPVDLVSFKGEQMERGNKLSWVTASEQNTEMHILERSAGGDRWEAIGELEAAGNSYQNKFYEMMDDAPLTRSFYRLKSLDFSGEFQYSRVINIQRASESFSLSKVFPVPVSGELNVTYNNDRKERVDVVITDLVGRVIHKDQVRSTDGENTYTTDLTDFANGVYFLSLSNGTETLTQRIIKN